MRRLGLLIVLLLLCAPAAMAWAGSSPTITTPLVPTSPWLTQTSPVGTPPSHPAASPATTTSDTEDLPYTGDNLGPESVGAVLLIGTGVALAVCVRRR